jgi:hypothetical protein
VSTLSEYWSSRPAPARPEIALPYYVSEIVYAAETARDNDKVVPGPGYGKETL